MCTLTWHLEPEGFDLFFNRDEMHTRRLALPPTVELEDGVSIVAPTDADAGGTWIAVNSGGLAVCLLNGHQAADRASAAAVSRGLLVRSLASAGSCAEVVRRVRAAELRQYRSFRLVAVEPAQQPLLMAWDGRELGSRSLSGADRPLVSAPPVPAALAMSPMSPGSAGSLGTSAQRRTQLELLQHERGTLTAADLDRFHRSHVPARGPHSVCMHRGDARTVSLTHVRVSSGSVRLRYSPGSPCEDAGSETVRLRRALAPASGAPTAR